MPCTVTKVPVTLQKCPFVLQKCLKKDRNVPFPPALPLSLSLSLSLSLCNNMCEGLGGVSLRVAVPSPDGETEARDASCLAFVSPWRGKGTATRRLGWS